MLNYMCLEQKLLYILVWGGEMCVCVCACAHMRSVVPNSLTPWTVACQAPLSMGFPRQEYRRGLPIPSTGGLPDRGSNLHLICLLHWQVGPLPAKLQYSLTPLTLWSSSSEFSKRLKLRLLSSESHWIKDNSQLLACTIFFSWQLLTGSAAVHGVAKSQTQLSDWTELNHFPRLLQSVTGFCSVGICWL